MLSGLKHAHSGWRWVVLVLLVLAVVNAYRYWKARKSYDAKQQKMPLYALIATHLQLLFGFVLYFISPYVEFASTTMSDSLKRFYTVEHILMMVIAAVLITVGYSKAKKAAPAPEGFKKVFVYYLIALILILAAIPWPFRSGLAAGWF